MTLEAFTALPPDMKKQVIIALFISICDGLGEHGGFLRAYGGAIAYADHENFELMRPVSEALILKYHLHWHASVIGTVVTCQNKEGLRAGADGKNYDDSTL